MCVHTIFDVISRVPYRFDSPHGCRPGFVSVLPACVSRFGCVSRFVARFLLPSTRATLNSSSGKSRPALVRYCYECHSAAAAEIKGSLRLDSRGALLRGGETRPAVVPGDVESNLLISAIRRQSLEMPPDEKLPLTVIADFGQWMAGGVPDPRDHPPTADEADEPAWQEILQARRDWWSLKPLSKSEVPAAGATSSMHAIRSPTCSRRASTQWSSRPAHVAATAQPRAHGLATYSRGSA